MSAAQDSIDIVPAGMFEARNTYDTTLPPKAYVVEPLTVQIPIASETDSIIASPDSADAAARGFQVTEAIAAGVATAGPGAGETWHSHPDFVEIVFYIMAGTATFWWKNGDEERRQDVGPGDFVMIRPGSAHQWLNTGTDDLKYVFFQHSHDHS